MVRGVRSAPAFSASLGGAAGFYCFALTVPGRGGSWILPLFSVLAALAAVLRVLSASGFSFSDSGLYRFFRKTNLHFLALCAGLALGIGAGAALPGEIRFGLPPETIGALEGTLTADPRTFEGGRGMGSLALNHAFSPGGVRVSARGNIRIFFPEETVVRVKEFGRGCGLYVEGDLVTEKSGSGAYFFRVRSLHVLKAAPRIERLRTGFRLGLVERFGGRDWGGLSLALLLGIRDNLDSELAERFRDAGCSHVLALSGMHLALISGFVVFLLKGPLGLRSSALGGAFFVILYVFLSGAQPSLVRAAIMYLLGTLALLGGLPGDPLGLLGMSFLIQIVLSPESGLSISFMLSYLALLGILTIGEGLYQLFRGRLPDILLRPLAASCGAFAAAAPVTALYFRILRPAGIIGGLFVVPLTGIFMIGSVIYLLLDLLFPPLAFPIGAGLSWIYLALDRLVRVSAAVPGISGLGPLPILILVLVLGAAVLVLGFRRQSRGERLASFD